jgi:hypothetical protein
MQVILRYKKILHLPQEPRKDHVCGMFTGVTDEFYVAVHIEDVGTAGDVVEILNHRGHLLEHDRKVTLRDRAGG